MNPEQNFFNFPYGGPYLFPPNLTFLPQPSNTQYQENNQVYQQQAEHQMIQHVDEPNIEYQINQHPIHQSNAEYPTNTQFHQPNVDLNLEAKLTAPLDQKQKAKRTRTRYTDEQLKCLEEHFSKNQYITLQEKRELAASLGIAEHKIKKWYQNRRMKKSSIAKQKQNHNSENLMQNMPCSSQYGSPSNESTSQSSVNMMGNDFREDGFIGHSHNLYNANNIIQNLDQPAGGSHFRDFSNYTYNDLDSYGSNLFQIPDGRTTQLQNFHPLPLLENQQNTLNNYYSGSTYNHENLTPSVNVGPTFALENLNPSSYQGHQNNYYEYFNTNGKENLGPSLDVTASPKLENFNPLPSQEDIPNIFYSGSVSIHENLLRYNEHEKN